MDGSTFNRSLTQSGGVQQRLTEDLIPALVRWRRADRPIVDGRVSHLVFMLGERDQVAGRDETFLHSDAVDLRPVTASEIADVPIPAAEGQLAVMRGDIRETQTYVAALAPAHEQALFKQRDYVPATLWYEFAVIFHWTKLICGCRFAKSG